MKNINGPKDSLINKFSVYKKAELEDFFLSLRFVNMVALGLLRQLSLHMVQGQNIIMYMPESSLNLYCNMLKNINNDNLVYIIQEETKENPLQYSSP